MDWVGKYVGIPYLERGRTTEGCDCWGLVRLVLSEQFGKELPSLSDEYDEVQPTRTSRLIEETVPLVNAALVSEPKPGDIAVMRVRNYVSHVGVFVTENLVLHTIQSRGPALENVTVLGKRIVEVRRVE